MLALTNILESVRFDMELHARHVEKFAFDFNLCTVLHSLSKTQGSLAQGRMLCCVTLREASCSIGACGQSPRISSYPFDWPIEHSYLH